VRLGVMQPYFFPYIGYFGLIAKTDKWIVFDVVQYNPKTWMTRNRILHPTNGWQYVNVPVCKASKGTLINEIKVKEPIIALNRILGQLEHYKKSSPYYENVVKLVREGFSRAATERLVDLNVSTLSMVCEYLSIPFEWSKCSELDLDYSEVEQAGQWALKISQQLGADIYINPPGGKEIFKQDEWDNADIKLEFTEMPDFQYKTNSYNFIENLSILDVLMWNSSDSIKDYLID